VSRATDIEAIKRTGKRIKTGHLDVRIAASPLAFARVGIIVPKYKHTVVERNKLRRRLRELVRTQLLPVLEPNDVIIRPWPSAYQVPFETLASEIERVVGKLRDISVQRSSGTEL
jgi:ribonuclease P protein component